MALLRMLVSMLCRHVIYHICTEQAWREAQSQGVYEAASLETEGFIHASKASQVMATAKRFFRDVEEPLVLLGIDAERLGAPLRFEAPAACEGALLGLERFPHLYGGLELEAVVDVWSLERDEAGGFVSPDVLKRRVIINRGISGSGKSSYTARRYPEAVVCSADHFFEAARAGYHFDAALLDEAHHQCLRKFLRALSEGAPLIVVDNTACRRQDVTPYLNLAGASGYAVEILRFDCAPEIAFGRNRHQTPRDVLERQFSCFEPGLPGWGERTLITVSWDACE